MARLLAGKARHFLRGARGHLGQGAGRRRGSGGARGLALRLGRLRRGRLGLRLGKAVVRCLVEGKIHPGFHMKVEERLESFAIGRVVLHGWYVSIRRGVDNSITPLPRRLFPLNEALPRFPFKVLEKPAGLFIYKRSCREL
jgi:hypothetical protein